jgi:hypothetical protein
LENRNRKDFWKKKNPSLFGLNLTHLPFFPFLIEAQKWPCPPYLFVVFVPKKKQRGGAAAVIDPCEEMLATAIPTWRG